MDLQVKNLPISTGSLLVAVVNQKDAAKLDLHPLDRIKIIFGKAEETVIIDIARTELIVPEGTIGVYKEVTDILRLRNGERVQITFARKPLSLDYIKKKLDGHKLSKKELDQIVYDIVHNKLNEGELTYFVAACYANHLTVEETANLTRAMVSQGSILKLRRRPIMDKHCVGGLAGNRTTPIVVPIVAAAGLTIPKTSSRSITSPAGTADTMEVMADVSISLEKMKEVVEKTNGCIVWGGSLNLAPADDKIIRVERPLSIDAESQLIASIMAKKLSVSSTHILLDIPVGNNAKIKNRRSAQILKKHFEQMAKRLKIHVKVIITDGSKPVGNGIGPSLEARDILWVLKGDKRGPEDLKQKSLTMAGCLLEMGNKARKGQGHKLAKEILDSGQAYNKMREIIAAQGKKCDDPDKIPISKCYFAIISDRHGKVRSIDNDAITRIARVAGAPSAPTAGVYINKHVGANVKKGEIVMTVYASCDEKLDFARQLAKQLTLAKVG